MRTMLLTAGLALMFSQGTVRPGDIPRPDVWIKNGPAEPIPVDLRELHVDKPIPVEVRGADPVRVRVVPPTWSYRTLSIADTADPAAALQALGASGWETTGLSWPRGQETIVLLKMQR
jgi:hypothetical protein